MWYCQHLIICLCPHTSGLSAAGGRKCRKLSWSECLSKIPVSSFSRCPCVSWLRSPFVVVCYHVHVGGFVLLRGNVKGRTVRECVFGRYILAWTRWSLPTRYLSTPTPLALVFGRNSPVGWNFGLCFYGQISQHKWLQLGEKAWLSA